MAPAQGGLASALNNTARQIGLAVGIAVLGALLKGRCATPLPRTPSPRTGYDKVLLIAAGLSLAGALAAGILVRQRDLWVPTAAPPG